MNAFPEWVNHGIQPRSPSHASMNRRKPEQKLRASCDGCFSAKLKCTKERPTCVRCHDLGLVCHYSPSQRTGKPRHRPHPQGSILRNSPSSQSPQPSPRGGWIMNDANQTLFNSTATPLTQSIAATSLSQPHSTSISGPQPFPTLASTQSDATFPGGMQTGNIEQDVLAQCHWLDYYSSHADSDSTYDLNDDFMKVASHSEGTPVEDDNHMTDVIPNHDVGPAMANDGNPGRGCHCFTSLVLALHNLTAKPMESRSQNLDAILNNSRAMLSLSQTVLACTLCSADSSTQTFLLAGLIDKYLCAIQSSSPDPCSTSPASNPLPSPIHSPSQHPRGRSSSRVVIGSYTMDAEDEERLRIEIILIELRKLMKLLEKHWSRLNTNSIIRNKGPPGTEARDNCEHRMHESVFFFLEMRIKAVAKGLRDSSSDGL